MADDVQMPGDRVITLCLVFPLLRNQYVYDGPGADFEPCLGGLQCALSRDAGLFECLNFLNSGQDGPVSVLGVANYTTLYVVKERESFSRKRA